MRAYTADEKPGTLILGMSHCLSTRLWSENRVVAASASGFGRLHHPAARRYFISISKAKYTSRFNTIIVYLYRILPSMVLYTFPEFVLRLSLCFLPIHQFLPRLTIRAIGRSAYRSNAKHAIAFTITMPSSWNRKVIVTSMRSKTRAMP